MAIGLFCGNAIVKILSSFSQGAHFILIHTDAHAVCGGAGKKMKTHPWIPRLGNT